MYVHVPFNRDPTWNKFMRTLALCWWVFNRKGIFFTPCGPPGTQDQGIICSCIILGYIWTFVPNLAEILWEIAKNTQRIFLNIIRVFFLPENYFKINNSTYNQVRYIIKKITYLLGFLSLIGLYLIPKIDSDHRSTTIFP